MDKRKIIQITTGWKSERNTEIIALCNDGESFIMMYPDKPYWKELPPIPQPKDKNKNE